MIAYIGLGSNLNSPLTQLSLAISRIHQIPQTEVVDVSSVYRSAPVGVLEQPDFFNQVISVKTQLLPEVLLQALLKVETEMGRVREIRFGPRVIDCDLLLHGDSVLQTETLVLPHPRMIERAFVLLPLREIYPDFIALCGRSIDDLCAAVADQIIVGAQDFAFL